MGWMYFRAALFIGQAVLKIVRRISKYKKVYTIE